MPTRRRSSGLASSFEGSGPNGIGALLAATTTARRVHRVDVAAKAVGAVVAVGNASIPLAVSFKVVR